MIRQGSKVRWQWGEGWGVGKVKEIHREPVTMQIKGATVSRDATRSLPAYLIEQDDGDLVLKSQSEVSRND